MAMTRNTIETLIRSVFPDAVIEITALADDNDHWSARVVSDAFRGKSRVQQHQMVYQAIGPQVGGDLHALALVTELPATVI
jgi:stress-induced morphogen